MRTPTGHLKEIAQKYRAGLCTPEEIEQIRKWYDDFEDNGYDLPSDEEIDRASNEAALYVINRVSVLQKKNRIRKLVLPVLKIAAVLLIVSSLILLIYKANNQAPIITFHEISALSGEKKQITLPDGSSIFLNSASSIRYPSQFTGSTREIHLKGEAFFEVAHDMQHPFIIHTEQLKVQVLGTSFDVKAYHQDEHVEVAVATGKVGVTNGHSKSPQIWMLTPGEQVNYNKSTDHFNKHQVLIADITSWQQNVLTFNFETLKDISHKLERVYGVTFVFKDKSILKKRFQLKVKNENLQNIMKLLSISGGGFKYQISGKQVIIG